jgi:hypothetical protein
MDICPFFNHIKRYNNMTDNTEQQPVTERICSKCGGLFIGNILASVDKVHVSLGPPIAISKYKQQVCANADPKVCLTKSILNKVTIQTQRPQYNRGFLTTSEIDDIATSLLKDMSITMPDRYITINWIEGARKVPVSVDCKYSCTTYIKEVDTMLSIIIEFIDSTNEGYLTFLKPELIKDIILDAMEFDIYEGSNKIAIGKFK